MKTKPTQPTQPTHTPTPWTIQEYRESTTGRFIIGTNTTELAYTAMRQDAAFIVRAVNAHEELLAACKEFMAARNEKQWDEAAQSIKEAIAKADGK